MSAFIDGERANFAVALLCSTLEVSMSAYYARQDAAPSARDLEDERLLAVIRQTHRQNYDAYGYRRTWKALLRAGETVPRCQVQRLMRENGIVGAKRRGRPWRTTTADPSARRAPDLVNRDFTAAGPDQLWVSDFTYARCWEGPVFFSFVLDVYSRKLVGWQFTDHMRTSLVQDAVMMALSTRRRGADLQLVHHSDAGSQYTSGEFTQTLDDHGVLASIGTVGDAFDNAMAESFVDTFKTELIADRTWRTRTQLELAIVEWVAWYNRDRLHQNLGDAPPVEYEDAYHHALALDAAGGGSGRDSRYALAPAAAAAPCPTVPN